MSQVLNSQTLAAKQANAKLVKTVEDLAKQTQALAAGVNAQSDLIEQIAQREIQLSSLEVQFNETKRQREVAFDLDLKASELEKVNTVLAGQGKVSIDKAALTNLQNSFNKLTAEFNAEVDKQVAIARGQAKAGAEAQIRQNQLELAAVSAEIKAEVNSLKKENALLASQVADYKSQITADREARVQESVARGNPVVTVQSGK